MAAIALIGILGLAVDLGHIIISKNETQAYCDSAALAAALARDGGVIVWSRTDQRKITNLTGCAGEIFSVSFEKERITARSKQSVVATTVPFLRTTPVLPLRLAGTLGYSMFDDLQRAYPWVLPLYEYKDSLSLISGLPELIAAAEKM